jgi:hypothetical protein
MKLDPKIVPVLIVALITWGGIFLYLLRVEMLTRKVQKELEQKLNNEEPRA